MRAPLITAVVPPAVDPVSLQTAPSLSVACGEHARVTAQGVADLDRSGAGWAYFGANYAAGDAAAAQLYLVAGG